MTVFSFLGGALNVNFLTVSDTLPVQILAFDIEF